MFKYPLILVWLGIVLLSGMFLIGQDTWERCQDNDGDGYGNPASNACRHPELDCHDDPHNDPAFCRDLCADLCDPIWICQLCAKCVPNEPYNLEDSWDECFDGIDNDCNGDIDQDEPYCSDFSRYSGYFEVTYDDITRTCPLPVLQEGLQAQITVHPVGDYMELNTFASLTDYYGGSGDWYEIDKYLAIRGEWIFTPSPPPDCSPSYRLTADVYFSDTNNFQGTLLLEFTYHGQCGILPCYIDAAVEGTRFFRKCDAKCCGEYVPCGKNGCYCWLTTEGDSICADDPLVDCEYLQSCSSSSDCSTGQRCVTCGCCGENKCMSDTCT